MTQLVALDSHGLDHSPNFPAKVIILLLFIHIHVKRTFLKASGPACTELEGIMLDWLAKMMDLPKEFMQSTAGSKGGGCIQV